VAGSAPEVDVFLFDTGVRAAHQALDGRVAGQGFSSFDNGIATEDCSGHGTHVAARIGGTLFGVTERDRLISVKVMNGFGAGDRDGAGGALPLEQRDAIGPVIRKRSQNWTDFGFLPGQFFSMAERAQQKKCKKKASRRVAAWHARHNSVRDGTSNRCTCRC